MHLVELPVIARTDQHYRLIDAAALASKNLWNAARSLHVDAPSVVSRFGVQLSGPRSAQRRAETLAQALEVPDATG
jgi:hypothetical protein